MSRRITELYAYRDTWTLRISKFKKKPMRPHIQIVCNAGGWAASLLVFIKSSENECPKCPSVLTL